MIFIIVLSILLGISIYWYQRQQELSATPTTAVTAPSTVNNLITDALLQQRQLATAQWLATVNSDYYTIQVMQVTEGKLEELAKFLRKPELQPILTNLYIYRSGTQENAVWGLVYHQFVDAASATEAITRLPDVLQRNRPFVQLISQLREKRLKKSSTVPNKHM